MKVCNARNAIAILTLLSILIAYLNFTGCRENPHDLMTPVVLENVTGLDGALPQVDNAPWATVIDFESLPPDALHFESTDRLIDLETGVEFSALSGPGQGIIYPGTVGQVTLPSIDGCQKLIDASRKLGTAGLGEITGSGNFGIRVTFPEQIESPAAISVEFYTKETASIHVRLLSASNVDVASLTTNAIPATDGTCGFSNVFKSRTVVTVTAQEPVASAVLTVTEQFSEPGGSDDDATRVTDAAREPSVFVIDNLRYGSFFSAGLDIRPGSCPNPFNPKSQGVLPVALLGGEDFDVRDIDLSSLRLEGVEPIAGKMKYKSVPGALSAACVCSTGNPDSFEDLELKFRTPEIAEAIDPVWPSEIKMLTLAGILLDGTPFEATDCVKIVGIQEPTSEVITRPDVPTGPSRIYWYGSTETHCAEGAVSSSGHPLQYRFWINDVPNRPPTEWQNVACISYQWDSTGTFEIRAQARCAIHTDKVSDVSEALSVTVMPPEYIPVMHFATTITRIWPGGQTTVTKPYHPAAVLDTVGMFRPFSMSYHGTSLNGPISAYKYLSLSPGVDLPGAGVWTTDLSDTVRSIYTIGDPAVPSGTFRLGAQCRDILGAESVINAGTFDEGVCQVVVNFDPDTKILFVINSYTRGGIDYQETLNLSDAVPDTVPYNSWIRLDYAGWDSPLDSILCGDDLNKCIQYQMSYKRYSDRFPWAEGRSRWLPDTPTDTNPFGTPDSMSMNIGTVEYDVYARSVDENGRPDGTPAIVSLVGNFNPTLDEFSLENHTGLAAADGDTIVWDWWAPADSGFDFMSNPPRRFKRFNFKIGATGHDHPKDPDGSGVKSWLYEFRRVDDPSVTQHFARSDGWVEGVSVNVLNDEFSITFTYGLLDPNGDDVFNNLPDWINRGYDFSIRGRDTGQFEEFDQYVIVNGVRTRVNAYNVNTLGRWTAEEGQRFYFKMQR
jgi:hypothetical protein